MRYLLSIVFVGAALGTMLAGQPSRLDVPVPGPFRVIDRGLRDRCALWTTVEQVARRSRVRVGFEESYGCWPAGTERDPGESTLNLDGWTPRAAFDYLMGWRPDFRWREIDGVVVIRPVVTWENPTSPLNRSVDPFVVTDVHPTPRSSCVASGGAAVALGASHRSESVEPREAAVRGLSHRAHRHAHLRHVLGWDAG